MGVLASPGLCPLQASPSSHPLDLKQLHIGVIPDRWVHIPVEGAGRHGVLKVGEMLGGGKAQTPPSLLSHPGQRVPTLNQTGPP